MLDKPHSFPLTEDEVADLVGICEVMTEAVAPYAASNPELQRLVAVADELGGRFHALLAQIKQGAA